MGVLTFLFYAVKALLNLVSWITNLFQDDVSNMLATLMRQLNARGLAVNDVNRSFTLIIINSTDVDWTAHRMVADSGGFVYDDPVIPASCSFIF